MRYLMVSLCLWAGLAGAADLKHGIAMHGEPKYPANFKHFEYVNPDAPKGGEVRQHAIGTFDSFNPYIVKGVPVTGIGLLYESLLTSAADEAFTEYGLLAETIEMPEDRSWVAFNLRKEARFHDGSSVTADDVVFSFNTLKSKGAPLYRIYYANVTKAEKTAPLRVMFSFKDNSNRELPLILGQMPILSQKYWEKKEFENTTLEPPISTGPYKIKNFEPGRFIVYERDPNYWGKNVPAVVGFYNFDRIRYDYYRDSTVALEALKAGEYDFRLENESKKWATEYDFPAITQGLFKKESLPNQRPTGMQAFAMNLRRPLFQDRKVREALSYAFDFEWSNKNLFYGQYKRTESYFSNSELAAIGLPSPAELKLLEPYKDQLPAEVFTKEYKTPASDGSGNIRDNLRTALNLLKEAGWEINKDRKLAKDGKLFKFEILISSPAWERISLPFIRNLERLGIEATVRTLDTAQYKNRSDSFDFDMIVDVWGESLSPGNEQREYWTSVAADMPGSRNSLGLKSKIVDELVEKIISAHSREDLITATRALDRVLLWGHYVIPHWHINYDRVAYWDKFGKPDKIPQNGFQFLAWWMDNSKPAARGIKTR